MMNNDCPLGFECVINKSAFLGEGGLCLNAHSCYIWTTAWELPYWRDDDRLIVNFLEVYDDSKYDLSQNPITQRFNWEKYFAEYGFVEAIDLPYFFLQDNTMIVYIADNNICWDEIQKAGYANAMTIPLQKRVLLS